MPKIKEEVSTTDIFYMSEFENSVCNDENDGESDETSTKKNIPSEDDPDTNGSPGSPCKWKCCPNWTGVRWLRLMGLIVGTLFIVMVIIWVVGFGKNLHNVLNPPVLGWIYIFLLCHYE